EATRASIIETLKRQMYIEVRKNQVTVLDKGKILCQAVEGTLLASPEMTAKWETYLKKIGKDEGSQELFLDRIKQMIQSLMEDAPNKINQMQQALQQVEEQSSLGNCPSCKKGMIQDKGKFYGCTSYHDGCRFTLSKKVLGKTISQSNIKKLLNGERTNFIKGFKSKKGKSFDAYLRYIKEIKTDSVVFIIDVGEIEIEVDTMTKDTIEEIFQANDEALIPLDVESGKVTLDG